MSVAPPGVAAYARGGVGQTRLLVLAAAAVAAVIGGAAAVQRPDTLLTVLAGVLVIGAMTLRLVWATAIYLAAAPFGDALRGVSSVSIKGVGLLLLAAWLIDVTLRHRPVRAPRSVLRAAGALVLALLVAITFHSNGSAGLVVATRYLSFVGIMVILADVMRDGRRLRGLVAVYVWSCGAAAVTGVLHFLISGDGRASGPLSDPNDFAFYLVSALPFALALRRPGAPSRHLYAAIAVLLVVATILTFSRGGLLGIAAMVLFALVTGRLRARTLVAGLLAVAVAGWVLVTLNPGLVRTSLQAKQHVAQQNVDDRLTTWAIAAEMTADSPLVGKGPGGFAANFDGYLGTRQTDPAHLDVAHEMYLDVASELGLLGLAAFLGAAACGLVPALRRSRRDPLAHAVAMSFVGVLVAATFLSEQYYLPVWLLAALGASLPAAASTGVTRPPERKRAQSCASSNS